MSIPPEAWPWIEQLHLAPHPEGGYYRETYRAPLLLPEAALPGHRGGRAAATGIYFLLAGEDVSAFHRIRSDEMWHFYAGSGLAVHMLTAEGEHREILVGRELEQGEQFQAVVPAGCWFGSALRRPAPEAYALVGCTVAPGFDFADFEMARRTDLLAQYPRHRSLIERLTRS